MDICEPSLVYQNKVILAPMVRIGTLPMRLLALQYGADIVYCEEIIDYKILNAQRLENKILGTVDYVLSDSTLVFQTHPSEKDKLVFQIGTSNAKTALRAAKKVEKDVSGIDVNMGCPKEFSLKGGMGAALLKKPETIKEILTELVRGVSLPVTCKIRLLPELDDNISLVKMIENTGVAAVAIHGRLTEERPRHPNRNETIRALAQVLSIPVIANGGSKEILCYDDIGKFCAATGASSVMIARAAEWNPSIFRREGKLPVGDVVRQYLKRAIDCDNGFVNTKYCILMMMHADMDQQDGIDTQDSKCMEDICKIWGMMDYLNSVCEDRKKRNTNSCDPVIKRRRTEDGKPLIEMPVRFIKKDYPKAISPKLKLFEWTRRHMSDKPLYHTVERAEDRCYKCVLELDGTKYTSSFWEKSKQLAEQAAAIICLIVLGEDDGRTPDCDNPSNEVARIWKKDFQTSLDSLFRHKAGKRNQDGRFGPEMNAHGDNRFYTDSKSKDTDIHNDTMTTEDSGLDCQIKTNDCHNETINKYSTGETTGIDNNVSIAEIKR